MFSSSNRSTGSFQVSNDITAVLKQNEPGDCLVTASRGSKTTPSFFVVLEKRTQPSHILVAWWSALLVAERQAKYSARDGPGQEQDKRGADRATAKALLEKNVAALEEVGWDLGTGGMETRSSARISVA